MASPSMGFMLRALIPEDGREILIRAGILLEAHLDLH